MVVNVYLCFMQTVVTETELPRQTVQRQTRVRSETETSLVIVLVTVCYKQDDKFKQTVL